MVTSGNPGRIREGILLTLVTMTHSGLYDPHPVICFLIMAIFFLVLVGVDQWFNVVG